MPTGCSPNGTNAWLLQGVPKFDPRGPPSLATLLLQQQLFQQQILIENNHKKKVVTNMEYALIFLSRVVLITFGNVERLNSFY